MLRDFFNNIILIVNRKNKCQNEKNYEYRCLSAIGEPTGLLSAVQKPIADVAHTTLADAACRRQKAFSAIQGPTGTSRAEADKGFGADRVLSARQWPTSPYRLSKGWQALVNHPRADKSR